MIRQILLRYAARLRYPRLLAITLVLFILDVLIPDMIPFVDEILLGLLSLVLAGLKKRTGETFERREPKPPGEKEKKRQKILDNIMI